MNYEKQISEKEEIQAADNGVKEIIIRRGEANKVHVSKNISLNELSIASVQEYLSKEGVQPEEIQNSFIVYSYEGLYLHLEYATRREGANDSIGGILKLHPELAKWKINQANAYDHQTLSNFIKMNRHFFENKETAMKLVSELRNIRVKVDQEFERADDKRGNAKELLAQRVTESNIPASFVLNLPIFVGTKPRAVAVEIEINPKTFECELISPDLKAIIDLETRVIIDEQLDAIRALYPQLRIFQK